MMVSKTKVSKKSGGCGCGGGGSKGSGSGCSCGGGTDCGTCNDQAYVRPNFFAGQLLTEEDLQSLSDYVVAKNRLHNRYLFGDGVVCGLEVTCHPCGGGKVIVKPGYAIRLLRQRHHARLRPGARHKRDGARAALQYARRVRLRRPLQRQRYPGSHSDEKLRDGSRSDSEPAARDRRK